MPQIECYGMQGLCAVRFTRLQNCLPTGGPVGASVYWGFVDAELTPAFTDVEPKVVTDSCDNECLKVQGCVKPGTDRWDIAMTLCGKHDIEGLYDLVFGYNIKLDADGNAIGFATPGKEAPCSEGVLMDMWVRTVDPTGSACGGASSRRWWRAVLGRAYLRPGALTLNNDITTLPVEGYAEPNPALADLTDGGPYGDWPWDPAVWNPEEVGVVVLDPGGPPPATCGYLPETAAATGATAGTPGTWTPSGATPPASLAALQSSSVTASPATAWTTGQYVQTGTAGSGGEAHWDADSWEAGRAT